MNGWMMHLVAYLFVELLVDGDGHAKDTGAGMASIREKAVLVLDEAGTPQLVLL